MFIFHIFTVFEKTLLTLFHDTLSISKILQTASLHCIDGVSLIDIHRYLPSFWHFEMMSILHFYSIRKKVTYVDGNLCVVLLKLPLRAHLIAAIDVDLINGKEDNERLTLFFKNWPTPASFCLFLVFWNKHYKFFTTNICEKMSIQYMVPGFEPMTFGTWVSSHNH